MELDSRLHQALRQLPVPPPQPGFAARVFAALPRKTAHRARQPLAWAMAASLAAAVGLGVWLDSGPAPVRSAGSAAAPVAQAHVVALQAGKSGPVRLSFRSPRDLTGVTIRLQLPHGVELEGYPGRQSLEWQTDLQAGANVLELPLVMRDGEGGILTATLDSGRSHKAFTVQVRADRPAALFPDSPATRSAVDGRHTT
jgi:hypothetical protein